MFFKGIIIKSDNKTERKINTEDKVSKGMDQMQKLSM